MFFTEANQSNKWDRVKVFVFVIICIMFLMAGCSQGSLEAPFHDINLWGFGNKDDKRSNTFTMNSVAVADIDTYRYFKESEFSDMVRIGLKQKQKQKDSYQPNYQKEVRKQIKKLKKANRYTMDYPLFIQNAFGTNSSGLYVYMGPSKEQIHLYYTISAEDESIPDFTETMYMNIATSKAIEGQIVGLVSGQYNKLVIELRDGSGNRINHRAYLLYVPKRQDEVLEKTEIINGEDNANRGLFHMLSTDKEGRGNYLFYDNYGILRSQIPTSVSNKTSNAVRVKNQLFLEIRNNSFVLIDNLGGVLNFYEYDGDYQLIDYDYDDINHRVLFLAKSISNKETNCVFQLDLEAKEWTKKIDVKKLIRKEKDLDLCSLQVVDGKDIILCSKKLSSILRINNIDSRPVVRWILGEEEQWSTIAYESLVLYEYGNVTTKSSFDSVTQIKRKDLKEGQLYLSLIDYNTQKSNKTIRLGDTSFYRKYLIDENQNKYRLVQQFEISPHKDKCTAFVYGKHVIISYDDEKEIVEYNEKGEIVLRMRLPNSNFSYHINKDSMDRYWF